MSMNRQQFQAIRLRDFRCFHEKQTARLAPLTLLIGDNSTGKTSFLAAVRAIWEVAYRSIEPDFRASPYDLGAFAEILHNPENNDDNSNEHRLRSFELGFTASRRISSVEFDVTFESRAAAPSPASIRLKGHGVWIKFPGAVGQKSTVEFGSRNGSWRFNTEKRYGRFVQSGPSLIHWFRRELYDLEEFRKGLEKLNDSQESPSQDDLDRLKRTLEGLGFFHWQEEPFASAPIRSSPRRTYDPTRSLPDPEGAYVPTYFASVHFGEHDKWNRLKEKLESFGRDSGLFHEIGVKQLGDVEGGPFQLEIKKYGKRKEGRNRNLIDVGYGVSQVLPVIAELFRPSGPPMFLFQHPEVHLHPSAQAALGSLFCETAASGRQLIIETHSDYILDRILLDIRDKRTKLKPDEVSILYFEREDQNVSIHSIRVDGDGNVQDVPEGYRRFFADELKRVVDY